MPTRAEVQAMGSLPVIAKHTMRQADAIEALLGRVDEFVKGMARGEDAVGPVIKAADDLKHQVEWALNDLAYTAPEATARRDRAYAAMREALVAYTEARAALK